MSAVFSFVTPDAVYLLTDRAGYDTEGVVQYIGGKVSASATKPVAIVTRGDVRIGEHWKRHLHALIEQKGIHAAVAMLPGILETMSADPTLRAAQSGEHYVEVTTAGWSPLGGFHLRFDTADWRVKELDAAAYAGPMDTDPHEFFVCPSDGETPERWMRRGGVAMMEAFRCQRGRDKDGHSVDCFWIGGGLDFTVIDKHGVRTETVVEWSDVVGEKISPQTAAA